MIGRRRRSGGLGSISVAGNRLLQVSRNPPSASVLFLVHHDAHSPRDLPESPTSAQIVDDLLPAGLPRDYRRGAGQSIPRGPIRASLDEQLDHVEVAALARIVQRHLPVTVTRVDLATAIEHKPRCLEVAVESCAVQRRPTAVGIAGSPIDAGVEPPTSRLWSIERQADTKSTLQMTKIACHGRDTDSPGRGLSKTSDSSSCA